MLIILNNYEIALESNVSVQFQTCVYSKSGKCLHLVRSTSVRNLKTAVTSNRSLCYLSQACHAQRYFFSVNIHQLQLDI